jgi:hypothetical protein
MSKIVLNNNSYYFVDDVKQICPVFFYGCAKTSRMIIDKRNIDVNNYIYATFAPKTNKWSVSDKSIKSAKLLLTCDWVEKNVPKWKNENGINTNTEKFKVEIAPPLLELKDEEKLKDENGNIVEIETRGVKTFDGIYFYGKDVERILELNDISSLLNHETSSYEPETHYKKFYRSKPVTHESNAIEFRIYLTYFGLVKILITTKNKIAEKFQIWAIKTLFTVQMGNQETKEELGISLLNINTETYRNVFKTHTHAFPCVYLEKIGNVKDLKDTFNIDETIYNDNIDSIICKFGFTDDIERRLSEHQRDYGKLKNVNLELLKFTIVETKYKVEAEQELRKLFQNFNKRLIIKIDTTPSTDIVNEQDGINNKNRYELVILSNNELETVFKYYSLIGNEYAGSTRQLQNKLEKMKHGIELKTNEIELIKLENKRNLELAEKDKEMLKKELKIQELEHLNKYKELELKMKEMEILCLRNNIKI